MTMTATQFNRNCQNFVNALEKSEAFDGVKALLVQWKDQNKPATKAIDTFMKIAHLFQTEEDLVEEFNKCLVKEANILKKSSTNSQVKQMAMQNSNSGYVLDAVFNWLKNDQKQKVPSNLHPNQNNNNLNPAPSFSVNPQKIEELTEQQLLSRIQMHRYCKQLTKIVMLYRKCVITLKQFKSLIEPIYLSDPSVFNMLFQYAEQSQAARRKITIFAPLTQLVDQKYPAQQVGNSYIIIPDGYANYSHTWAKDPLQKYLNRICCSVPLGSEGSFVIARKNQYEQQLFTNEQQKYQIDQNICMIKGAISKIQRNKNLNTSLLQKLLIKIYPQENIYNIMISQPLIAKNVVLPRLQQKLQQLTKCKYKFEKTCQEISNKNFSKSLDYRCFYFRKNDKKFNSVQRWEMQIQLRKAQIADRIEEYQQEVTDREALQSTRSHVLNTFDNITKEQLLKDKKVDLSSFDKKQNAFYPQYPHNQTLFIMYFQNQDVFNDVLEIILYHCQKKNIFQLIVLRLFKKIIKKHLIKDSSILSYIQSKSSNGGNNQNNQNSNFLHSNLLAPSNQQLNESKKQKKVYKDINEQFNDLIEQEIQPLLIQQIENPFEGPNQHTFICTKNIYNFIRYLLTIYHRFLKAKEMSEQKQKINKKNGQSNSECTLYSQFLAIMIFKIKDNKLFQQYLRKITTHQAYIFFTLDKFITSITKLVNNINSDSLTYKILKDDTKDYELDLKKWNEFIFPSVTKQLTRVYQQQEQLFRFTYTSTYYVYISMWENTLANKQKQKSKKDPQDIQDYIFNYLTKSKKKVIRPKSKDNNQRKVIKRQGQEYSNIIEDVMLMKGQYNQWILKKGKRESSTVRVKEYNKEMDRLKKFIKRV